MSKDLRNKLIRLAHQKPELRKDLLPLLTEKKAAIPIDEKAEKIGLCMLEKMNRELHPSINRIGLSRDARYDFRIDYSSTESYFHLNDVNPIQYGNPLELTESTNETIRRIAKKCGANLSKIKWDYVSKRVLGHPEDYIKIIRR